MKSLVLLSGGLDSAVALHLMKTRGDVIALSLDYGQRHRHELTQAIKISKAANVPHTLRYVGSNGFGVQSSLLLGDGYNADASPVVPGRNVVLLTVAAAFAQANGCDQVVMGACADDERDFPDCRAPFLDALREALRMALDWPKLMLEAPLLFLTKPEIVTLAVRLGPAAVRAARMSWSCYAPQGDPGVQTPCGKCSACKLRHKSGADRLQESPR